MLAKIKVEEIVENFETVRVRKDGTQINVAVEPGRRSRGIGVSIVIRDITESKNLEAMFRQCRKWKWVVGHYWRRGPRL